LTILFLALLHTRELSTVDRALRCGANGSVLLRDEMNGSVLLHDEMNGSVLLCDEMWRETM